MPGLESANLTSVAVVEQMQSDLQGRVADLRAGGILPTLAILSDNYEKSSPTRTYIGLKIAKANQLGMAVIDDVSADPEFLTSRIEDYNNESAIHGAIVQLPLRTLGDLSHEQQRRETSALVGSISPYKDVDGLGRVALFEPATPSAILSLLEGNGIDYMHSNVLIRGQGRLVGRPLLKMLDRRGALYVSSIDAETPEEQQRERLNRADVIISATGQGHSLTPDVFESDAPKVVVDAGTAEQGGVLVGDVSEELRSWGNESGWRFTPKRGGVGSLTVMHLLSNVVMAAEYGTSNRRLVARSAQ